MALPIGWLLSRTDVGQRLFGRTEPPVAAGVAAMPAQRDETFAVRRLLLPGEYTWLGRPAMDGSALPFVDRDGNLALKDLTSGGVRTLTNKGSSAEAATESPLVSPDGTLVAYSWIALDGTTELPVIRMDGTWPRVLLRQADMETPQPMDWSPDGKSVLIVGPMKDRTTRIALVDAADGAVRVLKDTGAAPPHGVRFSPDGQFVVFDRPSATDRAARDVFVLSANGGAEWPLVEHPANDMFPQWMRDGRVLFTSDRTGALGLWLVPVANGRASGEAEVVSRDTALVTGRADDPRQRHRRDESGRIAPSGRGLRPGDTPYRCARRLGQRYPVGGTLGP